jgi:hypothetical protein
MRHPENELLPTNAASITDVSHGIVLVLCAAFMVVPLRYSSVSSAAASARGGNAGTRPIPR